jgi:hypothetical protein
MNMNLSKVKSTLAVILLSIFSMLVVGCGSNEITNENDLTNNPDIELVEEAIKSIENIVSIEIVTEDNDPNGQLGKQGGYTGALFFRYSLVTGVTEESAIEAGTDGGGAIEVYASVDDAQKRNEYLSVFDGTVFSSGSHTVLGTLVIRTSNELTASQQQTLESAIINALQPKH